MSQSPAYSSRARAQVTSTLRFTSVCPARAKGILDLPPDPHFPKPQASMPVLAMEMEDTEPRMC